MSEDFLNNDILYFKNLIENGSDSTDQSRDFHHAVSLEKSHTGISDGDNNVLLTRQQAYHTNQIYDSIRDYLMEDYAIWNRYKYLYHVKKFQAYFFTVEHTASQYRQEYLQRFSREFKRAQDLGQLNLTLFSPEEKDRLLFIMKEPNRFFRTYYQGSAGKAGILGKLKAKLREHICLRKQHKM